MSFMQNSYDLYKRKTLKDSKMDLVILGVCYVHTMLKVLGSPFCKSLLIFRLNLYIKLYVTHLTYHYVTSPVQGRQTSQCHQCHGTGCFFGLEVSKP